MVSIITGFIGLATAIAIVILIRRDHLHVRYGLWWMAAAFMFALLGFFPVLFDSLAKEIGISYPPMLALTIAVLVLVIKILVMDIERSRNAVRVERLTQRIGLLESDLREMQGKPLEDDHAASHGELDDVRNK